MVSLNKENNSCITLCVNAGGRRDRKGKAQGGKEKKRVLQGGRWWEREMAAVANPHLLLGSGGPSSPVLYHPLQRQLLLSLSNPEKPVSTILLFALLINLLYGNMSSL